MYRRSCFALLLALLAPTSFPSEPTAAAEGYVPSIKEVLSLHRVGSPVISPDGSAVVYSYRSTDWKENSFEGELWLARAGEEPFQLTRTEGGSSSRAAWSPDGRWVAFLADRGHGTQVFLIAPRGGEARPLTQVEGGVQGFQWGPRSASMILRISDPLPDEHVSERESFGSFHLPSRQPRSSHLWWLDVASALLSDEAVKIDPKEEEGDGAAEDADADTAGAGTADADSADADTVNESSGEGEAVESGSPLFRRLTGGSWTVDDFDISPDATKVVFSHRPKDEIPAYDLSDLSVLRLETDEIVPLVTQAGMDASPMFSPDGSAVAFVTKNGEQAYYKNSYVAMVPSAGGEVEILSAHHDGSPDLRAWTTEGIYFIDWQRTRRSLFHLNPRTHDIERLEGLPENIWEVAFNADGKVLATYAQTFDGLAEIFSCDLSADITCKPQTSLEDQIADWRLGERRIVRWPSRDGLEIEGVLSLPDDFDSSRRYPLLVIIHGGPAAVSYPDSVPGYVYPIVQWLAKGAVILQPNYRGSDGYGESFRSANLNRLGIGDAWDVLSGVDYLIDQGFVDAQRMGVMGWSQGGYISAFLATTSDRFQGISVGAGISNWTTYYTNTDIPPFTRHYLSATPWDDPKIYADTSPMTFIRDAVTPTLIQHGENDRRVPTPNAYELYRGLQDMEVPSELIIYNDFGHGISRPKERLAAALHNWRWFLHTVWGEPLDLDLKPGDDHDSKPGDD